MEYKGVLLLAIVRTSTLQNRYPKLRVQIVAWKITPAVGAFFLFVFFGGFLGFFGFSFFFFFFCFHSCEDQTHTANPLSHHQLLGGLRT